jgi:hypothetical protein
MIRLRRCLDGLRLARLERELGGLGGVVTHEVGERTGVAAGQREDRHHRERDDHEGADDQEGLLPGRGGYVPTICQNVRSLPAATGLANDIGV